MARITPYPWQVPFVVRTIEILQAGDLCINTSDTGVGKTVMALAAAGYLGTNNLVIAPKVVHTSWRRTAEAMGVKLIGIVNAERLQYQNPWFTGTWQLPDNCLVIWDELHRGASGQDSKTTKILGHLKKLPVKVMPMSATIADSPLKMRGLGFLAGLHGFAKSSFYQWCKAHGCIHVPYHSGLEFTKGAKAQKYMLAIQQALAPMMVRARIADVPEFPDCKIQVELCDLNARDTKEINAIYKEMSEAIKSKPANELIERLRARQKTELYKAPVMAEHAVDAIEEGKAVVLFVNFKDTVVAIREYLNKEGLSSGVVQGGQADRERQQTIDNFQANKLDVVICTAAGGVGVNLHDELGGRPRVSYISPGDSASETKQALGRIWRATSKSKAIQTFVLAAGTVEEKVYQNLNRKLSNIAMLNDGDLTV